MRLVTRRRVKDAVLSDLTGLPVDRTESVSASRSTLQWRAVTVDGASKRGGPRIKRNAIIVRVRHRNHRRTWLSWKRGNIFIRMFNSANVSHWIPSTVHSTMKFHAWRLTRRTQFKIVHKSRRNVREFICANERMMLKGVRMTFTYRSFGWTGVLTIRTSNKNRASGDFSARSNIRAVRDFLIMKNRFGDHQIVNISVLSRRRYPCVYDFCRNTRKSSATKVEQAKVVILF